MYPNDIFQGLDWAPSNIRQAIISRRCKDVEKLSVLPQLGLVGPAASLPISIQTIFLDLLVVLIEAGMYLRSATLAVLLLAATFTYAQHGNVPLVNRLVRRAIRPDADTLRLIYGELYPQEGPARGILEQQNQETPAKSVAEVSDKV